MFDPQKHLHKMLNAAYEAGRSHAETIFGATKPLTDPQFIEKARDLHCEMLATSVSKVPALANDALSQGIFASVYSGFEDRIRDLQTKPQGFDICSSRRLSITVLRKNRGKLSSRQLPVGTGR